MVFGVVEVDHYNLDSISSPWNIAIEDSAILDKLSAGLLFDFGMGAHFGNCKFCIKYLEHLVKSFIKGESNIHSTAIRKYLCFIASSPLFVLRNSLRTRSKFKGEWSRQQIKITKATTQFYRSIKAKWFVVFFVALINLIRRKTEQSTHTNNNIHILVITFSEYFLLACSKFALLLAFGQIVAHLLSVMVLFGKSKCYVRIQIPIVLNFIQVKNERGIYSRKSKPQPSSFGYFNIYL